jgi:hypothetical protein
LRVALLHRDGILCGQLLVDLLAQIDPRPYQAQVDQVVAAKARDEALLTDARFPAGLMMKLRWLLSGKAVRFGIYADHPRLPSPVDMTIGGNGCRRRRIPIM